MDLTQGNIRKQLISMAVPAGIGMLFYTLYNVVDTFYAGLISTEALAGLAISFPVYFILLAFAVGFGQGPLNLQRPINRFGQMMVHLYCFTQKNKKTSLKRN